MAKLLKWNTKDLSDEVNKTSIIAMLFCLVGLATMINGFTNIQWAGVGAGFCALLTIIVGFPDYFLPPQKGDTVTHTNPLVRWASGLLATFSALLWIRDAWPPL